MKYDNYMDKECIKLCDAINKIPFLITLESCCGHDKNNFNVWLMAKNIEALYIYIYILARCIDRRYGGPITEVYDNSKQCICFTPWNLMVEDSDLRMSVVFRLTSNVSKGELAYKQAKIITKNINQTLKNKDCMKSWLKEYVEKR